MSQKKSRPRINKKAIEGVEVNQPESTAQQEQTEVRIESERDKWTLDSGEFDWDGYAADCPKTLRTSNPHVKVEGTDKVFSRASYAQEFYDILTNGEKESEFIPKLKVGVIYDGKVYGINETHATVDVNYRQLVFVKLSKEDPQYRDVRPGEEVSVLITEGTNDDERGNIIGTISGGMRQRIFMDLREGIDSADTAWTGVVKEMISAGGYVVNVQGVDCFMPGSLAGINKLHDFESIVGQELYVVPVSFSPERGTIVVSHRKYLQAMIPVEISKLRENITEKVSGIVTGTAKYGVFCEFNTCLTGMIHVNDLDEETFKKHKSQSIKPGEEIEFLIKEIVSNTKITLTQKTLEETNPWININERYKVPSTVEAKVKAVKDYGIFVTLEEGIVGLLHISEVGEDLIKVFKGGDNITVQITRIEAETRKVFLKLPS